MANEDFSDKVNKVLLFVLLLFMGLGFRCFQLAIIQHDKYEDLSKRPKRKVIIETPERGLIFDRNGKPLAVNELHFELGLSYDEIRKIPRSKFVFENGKVKKIPFRLEYIKKLSSFLGSTLKMDAADLEDFIHGKASLFPNQIFAIKEDLEENLYYKLRSLEKDWPGLKLSIKNHRSYPNGKLASHILGYMGRINQFEYDKVRFEMNELKKHLDSEDLGQPLPLPKDYDNYTEMRDRYLQLKNQSYQINSLIGKAGVEGRFEETLRGCVGKKKLEVDIMGREKRVLPDSTNPKNGDHLWLSIDSDLQRAAEILLTQHEEKRDKSFRLAGKNHHLVGSPWIKGGAIVAMDPKNGQILALASYPRFDPNDFLKNDEKSLKSISKWLEIDSYFSKIWEGELPLEKEFYNQKLQEFYPYTKKFTVESYIDTIFSNQSRIKKQFLQIHTINQGIKILKAFEEIKTIFQECPPSIWIDFLYQENSISSKELDQTSRNYFLDIFLENQVKIEGLKEQIHWIISPLTFNLDKLLLIDTLRLFIPKELCEADLPKNLAKITINDWFELNQTLLGIEKSLKIEMKKWFHEITFRKWREEKFKDYLKAKRLIEKTEKKPQKSYLEYLELEEKEQFNEFYKVKKRSFLEKVLLTEHAKEYPDYLEKITQFQKDFVQLQSNKVLEIFIDALRSSTFYSNHFLLQAIKSYENLDQPVYGLYRLKGGRKNLKLKDLASHFYPSTGFGFSRSYAFQEAAPQGSIFKVITAYEGLRQHVEKSKNSSQEQNPLTIIDNSDGKITDEHAQILGSFSDGKKITRYYKGGKLPRSSKRCGKISIKEALEMSSNLYFSILAADGLKNPMDLTKSAKLFGYGSKTGIDLPGEITGIVPYDVLSNRTGLYALSIGQHSLVVSPLQTAKIFAAISNGGQILKPEIIHSKVKMLEKKEQENTSYYNPNYLFQPVLHKEFVEYKEIQSKTLLKKLFFPAEIQTPIIEGLKKVLSGDKGTARSQMILFNSKEQKERYLDSASKMIGKTASAEIVYHPFLDHDLHPILCKHIWFASTGFKEIPNTKKINLKEPEIVIVVYLRYGDYGKEAALIASELYQSYKNLTSKPNQ